MKTVLVVLFFLHGLIHLIGLFQQSNVRVTNPALIWLVPCLLFFSSGIMIAMGRPNWWMIAIPAIIVSQVLITMNWHSAKWGTLLNIVLAGASIVSSGQWNFDRHFHSDAKALLAAGTGKENNIITPEMVQALPTPVSNWLSRAGVIGKEMVHTVRLKQHGFMRLNDGNGQWTEMFAEQYFNVDEPSFIWKVQMNMMRFLPVSGRDEFINGHGSMQIKLLSLVNIVNDADEKIDQGSLQRWLAEISWFPQAALMPYVHWESINAHAARARLNWKGVKAVVDFYFDGNDRVITCLADRYKGGGNNALLEKWVIVCNTHRQINGITIPTRAEVSWKLKTGDFNWCNLEITSIEYNESAIYSKEK